MEVREGYKRTEIGVIPEEWGIEYLGKKIEIYRGGSPRPIQNYITKSQNGVNWIKIGDVGVGAKYIDKTNEKIIPEGVSRSRRVNVGDFLLSNSMSFGRPYILQISGCIHDGWLVLQNYQGAFYQDYLYYILSSDIIINQYISKASGSSVLNLNKELVFSVVLPIPQLPEQQAIATALSDVDGLIGSLTKLINKKKNIKQGAMQELLTGKKRLEGFSGEWIEIKLGDVCEYANGSSLEKYFNTTNGYKVISIGNYSLNSKYIDNGIRIECLYKNEVSKFILKKNDLTMILNDKTSSGEIIGRVLLIDSDDIYVFNQRTMRLRINETYLPIYFYYLINSKDARKEIFNKSKPGTQIYINTGDVLNLEFKVPSLIEEQTAIANILSDMDAEIEALDKKLNKYKSIKQGMMQELLTGRIRLV